MLNPLRVRAAATAAVVCLTISPAFAADPAPAQAPPAPPAAAAKADPAAPVARVNGVAILQGEYDRHWRFFVESGGLPEEVPEDAPAAAEFRGRVLDRLVDEELLAQEAKRRALEPGADAVEAELAKARAQFQTPDDYTKALAESQVTEEGLRRLFGRNLAIQALVDGQLAKGVTVTDAEVHEFYAGNQDSFQIPEQVRARHILLEYGEQETPAQREEKRRTLEGLLQQVRGGADFAELARKHSQCPSAAEGGDLGFFERGQMSEAFEAAAFALKPGEVSGVVETEFGVHLIKLEERKAAGLVPEEAVSGEIREFLASRKTETAVEELLKGLRAAAKIEKLAQP